MVPGLNTPGLLQGTREWTPDHSRASPNLNRVMPGEDGGRGIDDYAGRLWHRLMRPNADQAVDLHTQSRGTAYPMYVFASTPRAVRMAELMAPDIIKLDQGEKGTVENEMVRAGVPAITLELGKPEVFDTVMVGRAEAGITNLMREMGMLAGAVAPRSPKIFVGNKQAAALASKPGFAHWSVALGDDVREGQEIGTISDGFGRIVERVVASVAGRISMLPTDPRRDRGDTMARIIHMSDAPECAQGC
jgi:predicted deacylase